MADHAQAQNNIPFSRPGSPGPHRTRVGFCGLGAMGIKIARNLANALPSPLLVYNRSRSKSEALAKDVGQNKIRIADEPAQLVEECDVIVTMLGNDDAVKFIYSSFEDVLKVSKHDKSKIFVEMSTIYPGLSIELDKSLSAYPHTHFVGCPVFGPPPVAEKAQLILAMSGDYRSKKEIAYLLVPAVGRKIIDLGESVQKAHTFKILGNSMILGVIEIMAEAMTTAEKAGISSEIVHSFLKDFMPAPPIVLYGGKIAQNDFDGNKGFSIDGGLKDSRHVTQLSNELNSPMPMVAIAQQHMLSARALHANEVAAGTAKFSALDWSALCSAVRVSAGMKPFEHTEVGDQSSAEDEKKLMNKPRDYSKKLYEKIKTAIHKPE